MQVIILAVGFIAVLIGSITDIQKREVADWLNYGLVLFGLGANALYSVAFWTWMPFVYSIVGFLTFLAIAYAMFYTGQWGGGDSKMLIGLGAVIGLPFTLTYPYVSIDSFFVSFWLNLLLAGVVYALLWSLYMAIRNRSRFRKEASVLLKQHAKIRMLVLTAAVIAVGLIFIIDDSFMRLFLLAVSVFMLLALYLTIFSKAVENAAMLKFVKPSQLTEGDWIAKDVFVQRERITGPRDLGISKKQISQLQRLYAQKKIRKVLIKTGIPFVPSFLAAFILTMVHGNVLVSLFNVFY